MKRFIFTTIFLMFFSFMFSLDENINIEEDLEITFENHTLGNQNYYRLHYINYHNFNKSDKKGKKD